MTYEKLEAEAREVTDVSYTVVWVASIWCKALKSLVGLSLVIRSFSAEFFLYGVGCQNHAHPLSWRTRVSLFVWVITFDLSGMGGAARSYTSTSVALRVIWPHKSHHCAKVGIPLGWQPIVS
jgi:hypothetical protein